MHEEVKREQLKRTVWHGIIGTGQSLSCGFGASIVKQKYEAPGAIKLYDHEGNYDLARPEKNSLKVVSLTEPLRTLSPTVNRYPNNIAGMTPHYTLARTLHDFWKADHGSLEHLSVHTCVGQGGAAMQLIEKDGDGSSYNASLFEAKTLARLAKESGADLIFDAVMLTHGETDGILCNQDYAKQVRKMQSDYATDLAAITGQEREPILILSQQNTCPPVRELNPTVIEQMWQVQNEANKRVICSGPKYQYSYADGLHLPVGGYNRLGEKYGQVLHHSLLNNDPFTPLSPRGARAPNPRAVVIDFSVPTPPLKWDDVLPVPHQRGQHTAFRNGRGFEVRDAHGQELEIAQVALHAQEDSISVYLTRPVRKWPINIAYAMTQDGEGFGPGFGGGTGDGRIGHLCDSAKAQLRDKIKCRVQTDSREIECGSGWEARAVYDILEPGDFILVGIDSSDPSKAFLDKAWNGPPGWVEISIQHNQQNYCVSFVMTVDNVSVDTVDN